jgi:precorrin-2 methylase
VSVAGAIAASSGAACAQRPTNAPGRPILIKSARMLTLDRTLGDFETADVLIEGRRFRRCAQYHGARWQTGLDFARLERLGDEAATGPTAARVKNSRV